MTATTSDFVYGLLSAVSRLSGPCATGNLTVRSTSGTVRLPKNAFCIPVLTSTEGNKWLSWRHALRTVEEKDCTPSGVSVAVRAVHGGPISNLPADTEVVWLPANDGIEDRSVVAAPGLTGGSLPSANHGVQAMAWSQDVPENGPIPDAVLKAVVDAFPAVIISHRGSPQMEPHTQMVHRNQRRFSILVVVTRTDEPLARAAQGEMICDMIVAMLTGKNGILVPGIAGGAHDFFALSQPRGIIFTGRRQRLTADNLYVFELTLTLMESVERIPDEFLAQEGVIGPWLRTRFDFPTQEDEGSPTLPVVEGGIYPHG